MSVPKKKSPRSNRGHRRGHQQLAKLTLAKCAKCKSEILPHQTCPNCGYYRGRDVLNLEAKMTKKERKKAAKEQAQKEKEEAQQKE
ncbi:50S ribosomal protein L32 [Patescibacteria group bacterium]